MDINGISGHGMAWGYMTSTVECVGCLKLGGLPQLIAMFYWEKMEKSGVEPNDLGVLDMLCGFIRFSKDSLSP